MPNYPEWLSAEARASAVRIDNWSTTYAIMSPFIAPECRGLALQGNVTGHPEHEDGHHVHTSEVLTAWHRFVLTRKRVYRLGRVDPKFLAALPAMGREFCPFEPIKVIG